MNEKVNQPLMESTSKQETSLKKKLWDLNNCQRILKIHCIEAVCNKVKVLGVSPHNLIDKVHLCHVVLLPNFHQNYLAS